jgi:hypothetical protein
MKHISVSGQISQPLHPGGFLVKQEQGVVDLRSFLDNIRLGFCHKNLTTKKLISNTINTKNHGYGNGNGNGKGYGFLLYQK